jgi:riboflavin synthase
MFSGIVEDIGKVVDIVHSETNVNFHIMSDISREAYIDQSISHNGVCLTVVEQKENIHVVTAISETLKKTNLGSLQIGSHVNLERSVLATTRMDGHFVQGHTDTTVTCTQIINADGSWYFTFDLPDEFSPLLVPQGSVCINGVSLTVAQLGADSFTVAIIPYTYEHTNFSSIKQGDKVNVEFDILGKYIIRYLDKFKNNL